MKKILFLADQPQRLKSQINLVNLLLSNYKEITITIVVTCLYNKDDFLPLKRYINFKVIYLIKNNKDQDKKILYKNTYLKKIKNTSIGNILYFIILFIKMKRIIKISETLLNDINPDILFVNGDRSSVSYEQAFLKVASSKKIKIIIPYTSVISDGITLRLANKESYIVSTIFDRIIFNFFPYITKSIDSYRIKFYDSSSTLVLNLFGVLNKNPWLIGNGLSNYICIDTQYSFNKYKDNMLNEQKFKIIGDIEYDDLYRRSIECDIDKFKLRYDLNLKKQTIILALPQMWEHNLLDWDKHIKEIEYIMNSLYKTNENILLSLHPKMNRDNYIYLEKKYNCKILNEQLKDVLIYADCFIAVNSSTVIWSVILGIKTVVLDYFNLDTSFFKDLSSIEFVRNKELLREKISNILSKNISFSKDMKLLSKNKIFDGKTIERYYYLIKEVTK